MLTSSQAWVVTAYIEGNIPVASNIMWSDGKTTTYVHGASDHHYRAYMAPYLLQWHEICAAKERGERWYDFWGVAPLRASIDQCSVAADQEQEFWHVWQWPAADAWSGVTRFKAGFGGVYVRYGEAREIAIGWKGKLVQVMLQIRKMILKG
jgi:lipid II:glycine glycyltransferase (peptidoglycan interpeptide bridge formation enzyme)